MQIMNHVQIAIACLSRCMWWLKDWC